MYVQVFIVHFGHMKGLKCKVCLAMWLLGMLTVEQVFNDSNHLPNFLHIHQKTCVYFQHTGAIL